MKILWDPGDCAAAVHELSFTGALPGRNVLVPRGRHAHSLRREIIRAGREDALVGTRFMLGPASAVEVLRLAGTHFKTGEEALRIPRLFSIFAAGPNLRHFPISLLRTMPGWDRAFSKSVADLEGAGMRPEDLERGPMTDLIRDAAEIWRMLDESAGQSWTMRRIFLEAALVLESRPEVWPHRGFTVAISLPGLNAAEARFLRAIPRCTIGFFAARPARAHYLERLEQLLGSNSTKLLPELHTLPSEHNERDILASYLFEHPAVLADPDRPRSRGPDGSVDLEEHAGVEEELESTTGWVARQVEEGIPLEEIAVLVPNLDPLAGLVAARLQRLPWQGKSLPLHVAGGLPLASYASGTRALSVIRALRSHLPGDQLVALTPYLRLHGDTARRLTRAASILIVWSLGTVGGNAAHPEGALEWSDCLKARQNRVEQQLREPLGVRQAWIRSSLERTLEDIRALRPAFEALLALARAAVERRTLSDLWPQVRAFFEEWLLQSGDVPRVQDLLKETLDALAFDGACGLLSGDDALRVIEDALLSARVPVGRFGNPAVYIGSIHEAAGLSFSSVRILGLAEGSLPPMPRTDPVIPDAVRYDLRRSGLAFLPTAEDVSLETLQRFDLIVRHATRRIALSAPRVGLDRSQREPSSVMLEAAAALARPDRSTGDAREPIPDRTALERDLFAPAREAAVQFRRTLPLCETWWQDGIAVRQLGIPRKWREEGLLDPDRIRPVSDPGHDAMNGLLGEAVSDLPVSGLLPERPISPSKVERLLRCPHAFLLGNLLGYEPPAAAPEQREIGQPMYGNLFHSIAAEFYNRNGEAFCTRTGRISDWLAKAGRIVDRMFDAFLEEYPLAGDAVRAQQRERIRRDVRDLIEYDWEHGTGGRFVGVELNFGSPEPVEFSLGPASLYLRGRIDRLDVLGDRALVRDLKTGSAHPRVGKETDPQPLIDLQLAAYGMVAARFSREWNLPGRISAAYAYFSRGRGERSFRDDFHEALEPEGKSWLKLAARLLSERLFPRTPDERDCSYCAFRPVCGPDVYERARELLAGAEGALHEFGRFKSGHFGVEGD